MMLLYVSVLLNIDTSIVSSLLVCTHFFLTEHNIIDSFKSKLVQINTKLHWKPYLGFNQTVQYSLVDSKNEFQSLLI